MSLESDVAAVKSENAGMWMLQKVRLFYNRHDHQKKSASSDRADVVRQICEIELKSPQNQLKKLYLLWPL